MTLPPPFDRVDRVLAVHAHPDDESLWTGITLAALAARGAHVEVLTCTLGEEGEVIPPELAHLEQAPDDPLGQHRRDELREAASVLGVSHQLLRDTRGRAFRDSGMAGSSASTHPRAFAGVPLVEAAAAITGVLERVRPDLVLTYDAHGGYGHPDHVRAHEATRGAVAVVPVASRPRLLACLVPRSWATQDRLWLRRHSPLRAPDRGSVIVPDLDEVYPPSVVEDDEVPIRVDEPQLVPVQERALRAHATQVIVGEGWFALSNRVAGRLSGREGYAPVDPDPTMPGSSL